MGMEIKIEVLAEGPDSYALCVTLDGEAPLVLQKGYHSDHQAAAALVEALTFAPPDMSGLEEAMGQVGQLLDAVGNLNQAMTSVGDRLNTIEDRMDELEKAGVPMVPGNALLRPRATRQTGPTQAPPAAPRPAPPPIRRPVHHMPHVPTGGAFTPGQQGEPDDPV